MLRHTHELANPCHGRRSCPEVAKGFFDGGEIWTLSEGHARFPLRGWHEGHEGRSLSAGHPEQAVRPDEGESIP